MPEDNRNIPLKYNGGIIASVIIDKDIAEKLTKLVTQAHKGFNLIVNCGKSRIIILKLLNFLYL